MELQNGKFLDNGGCGYVLKPEFLRNHNSTFTPHNVGRYSKPMSLSIRVSLVNCWFFSIKYENKSYVVQAYLLSIMGFSFYPLSWLLGSLILFFNNILKLSYSIYCCLDVFPSIVHSCLLKHKTYVCRCTEVIRVCKNT